MTELIAGIAYFIFVFFKAFQQRNVAFLHYKWILPISYFMATSELFVISVVAIKAVGAESVAEMIPMVLTVGTGGGIGALVSMWIHHKYIKPTIEK